ncbi:hypothetical protein [Streptomyces sp. NPDC047928]|uniref:hypothetical protein n=1 Tax=unclassified Streptomyces TaxID=2593676 RepID=UPI00371E79C1
MRGLSGRRGSDTGTNPAASTTAMAVVAAVGLLVTGCSTGGTGARDEGAARTDQVSPSTVPRSPASSAPPFEKVDVIRLIKSDPKVSDQVKDDLKPCAADAYPVDTSYGNLTNSGRPDVVVNVLTCGDAVGIGTYVYRARAEKSEDGGSGEDGSGDAGDSAGSGDSGDSGGGRYAYENVFAFEEPAVYSAIDRGDLIVTKQVYAKGDPVAYPSGEDVITYRWAGSRFTEHDRVHNEYSKAVDGGDIDGPAPTAPSEN